MKCLQLLILLLFSVYICSADDIPSITFKIDAAGSDGLKCKAYYTSPLIENQPFEFILKSMVTIINGRCSIYKDDNYLSSLAINISDIEDDHDDYFQTYDLGKDLKASLMMVDVWKCIFFDVMDDVPTECKFKGLKVRETKLGYMAVNENTTILSKSTNLSHMYPIWTYVCSSDEELVKVSCHTFDINDLIKSLSIMTNTGVLKVAGPQLSRGSAEMDVKLSGDDYFVCEIISTGDTSSSKRPTLTQQIHLNYTTKQKTKAILGFKVNNLTLTPLINNSKNNKYNRTYQYYYNEREQLEIISMDDDEINSLTCDMGGENIPQETRNSLKSLSGSKRLHILTTLSTKTKKAFLICIAKLQDTRTETILLKLYISNHDFVPYIEGLSMASTLLRYKENDSSYHIAYEHNVPQKLNLSCYSNSSMPEWVINATDVEHIDFPFTTKTVKGKTFNVISSCFYPTNATSTVIQCRYSINKPFINTMYMTNVRVNWGRNYTLGSLKENSSNGTKTIVLALQLLGIMLAAFVTAGVALFAFLKRKKINVSPATYYARYLRPSVVEYASPNDNLESEIYAEPYSSPDGKPNQSSDMVYADLTLSGYGGRNPISFSRNQRPVRGPDENYVEIVPTQIKKRPS